MFEARLAPLGPVGVTRLGTLGQCGQIGGGQGKDGPRPYGSWKPVQRQRRWERSAGCRRHVGPAYRVYFGRDGDTLIVVPDAVTEAFRQMRTGRPRPVYIGMPPGVAVEREEIELRNPAPSRE